MHDSVGDLWYFWLPKCCLPAGGYSVSLEETNKQTKNYKFALIKARVKVLISFSLFTSLALYSSFSPARQKPFHHFSVGRKWTIAHFLVNFWNFLLFFFPLPSILLPLCPASPLWIIGSKSWAWKCIHWHWICSLGDTWALLKLSCMHLYAVVLGTLLTGEKSCG